MWSIRAWDWVETRLVPRYIRRTSAAGWVRVTVVVSDDDK